MMNKKKSNAFSLNNGFSHVWSRRQKTDETALRPPRRALYAHIPIDHSDLTTQNRWRRDLIIVIVIFIDVVLSSHQIAVIVLRSDHSDHKFKLVVQIVDFGDQSNQLLVWLVLGSGLGNQNLNLGSECLNA